ncbi:PKD domain-containing protein [bacterium]|nr:PKD domain-containing protein [bacterium]
MTNMGSDSVTKWIPGLAALLLAAAALWSCGGTAPVTGETPAATGGESVAAAGLPTGPSSGEVDPAVETTGPWMGLASPRELLRQASAEDADRLLLGSQYDDGLPAAHVDAEEPQLYFSPEWSLSGSATNADLAYAFFTFNLPDYDDPPRIDLGWQLMPDQGTGFIGLGNQVGDFWQWFPVPAAGLPITPLSLADYIAPDNRLVAVIVIAGTQPATLNWLRIGGNVPPTADLAADPQAGRIPLEVEFSAAGSVDPDGTVVTYAWDLDGDGTRETDTAVPEATYTYEEAGEYTIELLITDNEGGQATDTVVLNVMTGTNNPPAAALSVDPSQGEPPLTVSFDAGASEDTDGSIVSYGWDWEGDETIDATTAEATTSHVYTASGAYIPVVTVTDNEGATDTAEAAVNVGFAPEAALSIEFNDGYAPAFLTADATASTCVDGIAKFEWDWEGDGTWDEDTGTTGVASHVYLRAGDYTPSVRVTSDLGRTDEASAGPITVTGFSRSFGQTADDYFSGVCVWSGGLYCAGASRSWGAGVSDAFITSHNADGSLKWGRTWGGGAIDVLTCVIADSSGNVYGGGYTWSFPDGDHKDDALLVKYDASGNWQWARTWGRELYDWTHDVALDNFGNIFCAAITRNEIYTSMNDLAFMKYDPSGNILWEYTYNSGENDNDPFLVADGSGGVLVSGRTNSGTMGGINGLVMHLTSAGALSWQRAWGGDYQDAFYRAIPDGSGGYYAVGYTMSFGGSDEAALLVKLDGSGNVEWARQWDTEYTDVLTGVHIGDDGKLYACGIFQPSGEYVYGLMLIFSLSGDLESAWFLDTVGDTELWDGRGQDGSMFIAIGDTYSAYGDWMPLTGEAEAVTGEQSDLTGALTATDATKYNAVGTKEDATGIIEDIGAGERDGLLIGFDTSGSS